MHSCKVGKKKQAVPGTISLVLISSRATLTWHQVQGDARPQLLGGGTVRHALHAAACRASHLACSRQEGFEGERMGSPQGCACTHACLECRHEHARM